MEIEVVECWCDESIHVPIRPGTAPPRKYVARHPKNCGCPVRKCYCEDPKCLDCRWSFWTRSAKFNPSNIKVDIMEELDG